VRGGNESPVRARPIASAIKKSATALANHVLGRTFARISPPNNTVSAVHKAIHHRSNPVPKPFVLPSLDELRDVRTGHLPSSPAGGGFVRRERIATD
jgi:hypothetical protein